VACLAKRRSRFGPAIRIEEEKAGVIAYLQGGYYQSRTDKDGVSLLEYVHALFGLLHQMRVQTVLVIGCAGGSLATMLTRVGCDVVAIDLDPQAFVLARRYFGLPGQVECVVVDGFDYMFATRRRFDAIVVDAFHGGRVASKLMSEAFFLQACKRLRKGGAILANVHVARDSDPIAERVASRMRVASSHVRILDRPGGRYRNAIVASGAVATLEKPALLMPPSVEAAKLSKALTAMQFKSCAVLRTGNRAA
jgi:spermidine synthase